jgi:MoaA/NifB/PqqE/SkfB family radical SAM enzyme
MTMSTTTIRLDLLALELTRAGPGEEAGRRGCVSAQDWLGVIGQAAALSTRAVCFTGGEPSMRPAFPVLLASALAAGLEAEICTSLIHVSPVLWQLYAQPGVRLAVSWDAGLPSGRHPGPRLTGAHPRTRENIAAAARLGIALRVRRTARGHRDGWPPLPTGAGGTGRAAVSWDGDVTPCLIGRRHVAGNVKRQPLAEILAADAWRLALAGIPPGRAAGRAPAGALGTGDGPDGGCGPR